MFDPEFLHALLACLALVALYFLLIRDGHFF